MDADVLRGSLALDEWRTVPISGTVEFDGGGDRWPDVTLLGMHFIPEQGWHLRGLGRRPQRKRRRRADAYEVRKATIPLRGRV